MKVLFIGSEGQLGIDLTCLLRENNFDVIPPSHSEMDIINYRQVSTWMDAIKPNIIINTAAIHQLDICERDPLNSFLVNSLALRNLAIEADIHNSLLIHISTDYVFSGNSNTPYTEIDCPSPLSVYGNSKLSGEHFIETLARKYFIIRTSGLYGNSPCRGKGKLNFVDLMIKIADEKGEIKVTDKEVLTPTWTKDLSSQILYMITRSIPTGIYHATSEGFCSWYDFAREIFKLTNRIVVLRKKDSLGISSKIRPKYSVLENANLKKLGINIMPYWGESLKKYLLSKNTK